jgi:predicted DNA-binding transcriptional regulator AlpA
MAQTKLAMSKREFCEQFGIGNTLFYKMLKTGEGPKLMRCGGRILVATDTVLAWMRSREEAVKPAKPARTKAANLSAAAPVPVTAAQDATSAPRPSSIDRSGLAAPRRSDFASPHSRVNVGGMPRLKAW